MTKPDPKAFKFPNLLQRQFRVAAPTWEGKLYVATVIDLYSRRLIGWAIAEHCRADPVCDALKMAIAQRGGHVSGVIFHSDRGTQYTSNSYTKLCRNWKITQSMSRSGSCLDNAVAESFFATFKTELVHRTTLTTKRQSRRIFNAWFDRYNRIRRHSHCRYQPPLTYEEATTANTAQIT